MSAPRDVYYADPDDEALAVEAAARLGGKARPGFFAGDGGPCLICEAGMLRLAVREGGNFVLSSSLCPLSDTAFRARCEGKRGRELLPRAFGKMLSEGAYIADLTAGAGADALLLAARGAHVDMIEREPVIALLAEQTLRLAREDAGFAAAAGRLRVLRGDALHIAFNTDAPAYDGYYIDPLYVQDGKSKAAKNMQLIRLLGEGRQDADGAALLRAALKSPARIAVVKRHDKAPYLAGIIPERSLQGKTVRYDIYRPG